MRSDTPSYRGYRFPPEIMLDPVYTGKAMAGLIDLARSGYFKKDEGVVFLHTGGTPALFAYEDQILDYLKKKK